VDRRFALFLGLSTAILAANMALTLWMQPHQPAPLAKNKQAAEKAKGAEAEKPVPAEEQVAAIAERPARAAARPEAQGNAAPAWVTLGSLDAASDYRMLVTLTNSGAAIERVELNSPRYRDLEDRSGYLGHLAEDRAPGGGVRVHVVGPGTPAAKAGLQGDKFKGGEDRKHAKAGDTIKKFNGHSVDNPAELDRMLDATRPGQKVAIIVERDGKPRELEARLTRRPLDVIRPEKNSKPLDVVLPGKHDPFSMLLTLERIAGRSLEGKDGELKGVDLIKGNWQIVSSDQDQVTFKKTLGDHGLEVIKRYILAKGPPESAGKPAYHVSLNVEIRNVADEAKELAYRLDGPTGLVVEGDWYASKISHSWSAAGMRDIIMQFEGSNELAQVTATELGSKEPQNRSGAPLAYIAVDGQYFAAALLPEHQRPGEIWFSEIKPLAAGAKPKEKSDYRLINASFRLISTPHDLAAGESLKRDFTLFVGPKKPDLLAGYGPRNATLDGLVYYGWFGWVASPMLGLLHFFHDHLVFHYALAIVLLTVIVRGCMFPLSRKQALSAQKMQELQPELKRLNEKYKGNVEQKTKAQQELFRKHNYNPLGGCLLMFIQLPIFIGLYRSLMVDVELRQAPLITEAIRWGSNLAAPDMLYDWRSFMPEFISSGQGILGLGPYLNVLPLVTIGLFIWQQKLFMPPPTDEQTAMQQKLMKYMMVFMGIMFFKVASGLCLYFIASSLWSIAERKMLPKVNVVPPGSSPKLSTATATGNGNPAPGRKKHRERK